MNLLFSFEKEKGGERKGEKIEKRRKNKKKEKRRKEEVDFLFALHHPRRPPRGKTAQLRPSFNFALNTPETC